MITGIDFMVALHERLLPGSRSLFIGHANTSYGREMIRVDRVPGKSDVRCDVGECGGKTWDLDQVTSYVKAGA